MGAVQRSRPSRAEVEDFQFATNILALDQPMLSRRFWVACWVKSASASGSRPAGRCHGLTAREQSHGRCGLRGEPVL